MPVIEETKQKPGSPESALRIAPKFAIDSAVARIDCYPLASGRRNIAKRLLHGAWSISFFPPCRAAVRIFFPTNEQAIAEDWKTVGQDLFTAIEQYRISELYSYGRSAEGNAAAATKPTWAAPSR